MNIFGISMIRNEADIIETNVLYHLSLGLDHVLVLDNGSTDGTDTVLKRLAQEDERVSWIKDDSPFDQQEMTTELARQTARRGADWVVPFDADEFWWTEGSNLREILSQTQAGALQAPLVNFVQSREVLDLKARSLLRMTYRVEEKRVGWGPETREKMEKGDLAYVEVAYPEKWISRPNEDLEIRRGNHNVTNVKGPKVKSTGIYVLHAPLRSRAVLENKAEQGRRLDEAGINSQKGWHLRRLSGLEHQGKLDEEWAVNSYKAGRIDLGEEKRTLVPDARLKDALSPILRSEAKKATGKVVESSTKPLFIAGCQRSGTTAFAEYMNFHPEVMLLRERYKFIPHEVTPDLLSFERILDYSSGETNVSEEEYVDLLGRKNPERLKWAGDKNPGYYAFFGRLARQNPGARFIFLYRPLEEVAESFDARAKDPEDHWPAAFDFQKSVAVWNNALNRARAFAGGDPGADILILDYRDFFYRNESTIPLISRFLELEFGDQILSDWKSRSANFEETRRNKNVLSKDQKSYLEEHKNHESEEWILKRIEDQKDDPRICFGGYRTRPPSSRSQVNKSVVNPPEQDKRNDEVLKMRRRVRHLSLQNQNLKRQIAGVKGSRTWRALDLLNRTRMKFLRH